MLNAITMSTEAYVFVNVPKIDDITDYLIDFLESVLDKSVKNVDVHPAIPDRALVNFTDASIDLRLTKEILDKVPIEEAYLAVSLAIQKNVLILDRRQYSHFEQYLESNVDGGKKVVLRSIPIPGTERVAACIANSAALENLLKQKTLAGEVEMQPFYHNFHGCIPFEGKPLSRIIEEAEISEKKKSPKVRPKTFPKPKPQPKPENLKPTPPKVTSPKTPPKPIQEVPLPANEGDDNSNATNDATPSSIENEGVLKSMVKKGRNVFKKILGAGSPQGPETKPNSPGKKEYGKRDEREEGKHEEDSFKKNAEEPPFTSGENENSNQPLPKERILKPSPMKPKEEEIQVQALPTAASKEMEMDPHHWDLLEGRTKDLGDYHSMAYDTRRQILRFESIDTTTTCRAIEDMKADIIEGNSLKIPDNLKSVFQKLEDSEFFNTCVKEYLKRHDAQCVIKNGVIHFYGWDEEGIDNAKKEMQNRFMHVIELNNKSGMNVDVLIKEKKDLELDFLVNISWTDSRATKIQVAGVYDDVSMAKDQLETIISKHKIINGNFAFSSDHTLYVEQSCQYQLSIILQNVNETFRGEREGKFCIEYSGMVDNVNGVTKSLDELKSSIKCEHIDVSADFDEETSGLITKALIQMKSDSLCSVVQNAYQTENKCCILNDLKHETPKEKTQPGKNVQTASVPVSRQPTPTLEVKVKATGDIAADTADVLVCVLHESKQLKKLRISKAFLRPIPDLQSAVDNLDFSSGCVQLFPVTSTQLNFKAIAFVLLQPWNEESSDDYIQQLISEVLVKAAQMDAKSVTFPPIGLGVVMKYRRESIAQQFISAIECYRDSLSKTKSIQPNKITILANDEKLHQQLEKLNTDSDENQDGQKPEAENAASVEKKGDGSSMSKANIKIIHCQDKQLAPLWRDKLSGLFVDDEFDLNVYEVPFDLEEKLKKLVLTVKISETEAGNSLYKFRGLSADIIEMKLFITQELRRHGSQPMHIISEKTPSRGSLEFVDYAAKVEESTPHYWTFKTEQDFREHHVHEVDVDDKTRDAIKNMFESTWDTKQTGLGNDAANIPRNSQVEFIDVKRVENLNKFKLYSLARRNVFKKKSKEKKLCQSISEVSAKGQDSLIAPYLPDHLKDKLCYEINECYLFHGTKPEIVETIKINGCDPNVSNSSAMFGKGVYAAECSTKCDQYTDDRSNRLPSGSVHYAFLLRMLLGDIFLCDHNHSTTANKDCDKLNRPPCKVCLKDKCFCESNEFYDSVMGEGRWIFREFVVYRDYNCYPEYLISYKRK